MLQRIESEISQLRKEKYESDVAFSLWMNRRSSFQEALRFLRAHLFSDSPLPQERSRKRRHRAPDGPYIGETGVLRQNKYTIAVYNLTEEQIDEDVLTLKRVAIEAKVSLSERGDNDIIYLRDVVTQ